jgi:ribose-phosphate pyrophosphokinase
MLMNLVWTVAHATGRHARRMSILTPYFPHARSDIDEKEIVLAKLKMVHTLVAGQTGDSGYHRWVCVDPHARQISDIGDAGKVTPIYLTRRLLRFALTEFAKHNRDEKYVLAFADDSSQKRYESAVTSVSRERGHEVDRVCAYKRRDMDGKSKIIAVVGDTTAVRGATVLMFDDEIDTGGSVVQLATRLKEEFGARAVWACATHGVMSGDTNLRFLQAHNDGIVERLILSDTVPISNRPTMLGLVGQGILTVFPCLDDLAWVIYRIHWDMSIRQMR